MAEVYSELCLTSMMELFAKILHGRKPLTVFAKTLYFRCLTGFSVHLSVCHVFMINTIIFVFAKQIFLSSIFSVKTLFLNKLFVFKGNLYGA